VSKKILMIDYEREIAGAIVAKSARKGRTMLMDREWDAVIFNNGLGAKMEEYDLLSWMLEQKRIRPPEIFISCMNGIAVERITDALLANNYMSVNPKRFVDKNYEGQLLTRGDMKMHKSSDAMRI